MDGHRCLVSCNQLKGLPASACSDAYQLDARKAFSAILAQHKRVVNLNRIRLNVCRHLVEML